MTQRALPPALPRALPPLPKSLLAPLLQWTGEALAELTAQDVPPALRPLLGFDRRGFGSAAARAQLHKTLESEEGFRARVFTILEGRDEVATMLRGWDPSRAVEIAGAAEERDDLPLLVSALVAGGPEGWEVGVGVAVGLSARGMEERSAEDDRRAFDTQVAKVDEALRRAEEESTRLRAEVERVTEELRGERASRREREEAVRAEAEEAHRAVAELEAALSRAESAVAEAGEKAARAEERSRRAEERADALDARLAEARDDAARARAEAQQAAEMLRRAPPPPSPASPIPVVHEVGEVAMAVEGEGAGAGALDVEDVGDVGERPVLTRRRPVELPPGVVGPSLPGLRAALSRGDQRSDPRSDPVVIVDGYNVSMLAWGEEPPDAQRQRLCALLERLHLRTNRSVTVVFDGADVEGVRPPRRPGVRVLFSAAGEEADEVVLHEVGALPLERPAVVVSSDRRVQRGAEAAGALAVPSDVFLEFLRK